MVKPLLTGSAGIGIIQAVPHDGNIVTLIIQVAVGLATIYNLLKRKKDGV